MAIFIGKGAGGGGGSSSGFKLGPVPNTFRVSGIDSKAAAEALRDGTDPRFGTTGYPTHAAWLLEYEANPTITIALEFQDATGNEVAEMQLRDLVAGSSTLFTWYDSATFKGLRGVEGKSAYQSWLDEGNVGTEADFLASLDGTDGLNQVFVYRNTTSADVPPTTPTGTTFPPTGWTTNPTVPATGEYIWAAATHVADLAIPVSNGTWTTPFRASGRDGVSGGAFRVEADSAARLAIPNGDRVVGMHVYEVATEKTYVLVGGITNTDWEVAADDGTSFVIVTDTAARLALPNSAIELGTHVYQTADKATYINTTGTNTGGASNWVNFNALDITYTGTVTFSTEVNIETPTIHLGINAGDTDQGNEAVAIGGYAGNTRQGEKATAVGTNAGFTDQGEGAMALGADSGETNQGVGGTAIGSNSGQNNQGDYAVAIGKNAGNEAQSTNAVAIGSGAGRNRQGTSTVAVGESAGKNDQGNKGIAIGDQAGETSQGIRGIAIGEQAGNDNQGDYAIAIGRNAGQTNQGTGGIIIKATSAAVDDAGEGHLHIMTGGANPLNIDYAGDGTALVINQDVETDGKFVGDGAVPIPVDASKVLTSGAGGTYVWADPTGGGGGGIVDAPIDGMPYVRKDGAWEESQPWVDDIITTSTKTITPDDCKTIWTRFPTVPTIVGDCTITINTVGATGDVFTGGDSLFFYNNLANTSNHVVITPGAGMTIDGGTSPLRLGKGEALQLVSRNDGVTFVSFRNISDAPADGEQYVRVDHAWEMVNGTIPTPTTDDQVLTSHADGTYTWEDSVGGFDEALDYAPTGDWDTTGAWSFTGDVTMANIGVIGSVDIGTALRVESEEIHLGQDAAETNQGTRSVAIGWRAGNSNQGDNSVAIGGNTGGTGQGENAVAVGTGCAQNAQGDRATAIGHNSGLSNQGTNALAIGYRAGENNQGSQSIAIGDKAGSNTSALDTTGQGANGIILNAHPDAAQHTNDNHLWIRTPTLDIHFDGGATDLLEVDKTVSVDGLVAGGNITITDSTHSFIGTGAVNGTGQATGYVLTANSAVAGDYEWKAATGGAGGAGANFFLAADLAGRMGIPEADINAGAFCIQLDTQRMYVNLTGSNGDPATDWKDWGAFDHIFTGDFRMESDEVHLGKDAGETGQGTDAVAVGRQAGQTSQGDYSVALGFLAGAALQGDNSIIISSKGASVDNRNTGSLAIHTSELEIDFDGAADDKLTINKEIEVTDISITAPRLITGEPV